MAMLVRVGKASLLIQPVRRDTGSGADNPRVEMGEAMLHWYLALSGLGFNPSYSRLYSYLGEGKGQQWWQLA